MADENTNTNEELNTEEQTPVVEEPVVEEPTGDKEPAEDPVQEPATDPATTEEEGEITPEQKAKAAYIALRYLGVTPPSL